LFVLRRAIDRSALCPVCRSGEKGFRPVRTTSCAEPVAVSFEETLGAILEAKLAPILSELRLAVQELRAAPQTQKEFLSVHEAAELVDVSETTVREWVSKGLRQYKQGRVVRLRRSELLAFLSADPEQIKTEVDMEGKAIAFLARTRIERG
jgi:excisionase family DNA binding protein